MTINDLYDMQAFGDYIAQQKGAGLIPEFTNIRGATGFQVGGLVDPMGELVDPLDSLLEDEDEFPDLDSFEDQFIAKRAYTEIKQKVEIEKEERKRVLREDLGIPKMLSDVASWKATGLGTTDLVAGRIQDIAVAEQEVRDTLAREEDSYKPKLRYLDRLSNRIDELAPPLTEEQRYILSSSAGIPATKAPALSDDQLRMAATITGQERQPAIALINKGLQVKHGQILSTYLGHTPSDLDIAGLSNDDVQFIINEEESNGSTSLIQVLNTIPESFDLFTKKIPLQFEDKAEAALMLQEANKARDMMLKAESEAKLPTDNKTLLARYAAMGVAEKKKEQAAQLAEIQGQAATDALNSFNTGFINDYFKVDTSTYKWVGDDIDTIANLLEDEENYKGSIFRAYKAKLQTTLDNKQRENTSVRLPSAQEIINDLVSNAVRNFNGKYSDTMGVYHAMQNLPAGVL